MLVATFMETLKVQGVVNHLIHILRGKGLFANLELENEDDGPDDCERIDSAADARDGELEVERANVYRQNAL